MLSSNEAKGHLTPLQKAHCLRRAMMTTVEKTIACV